jgi:zinc D-Ala-D-Ala dipeptidase
MKLFWSIIFLFFTSVATAQDSIGNKYAIKIISNEQEYVKSITNKPGFEMVDLKKAVPGIVTELRYASNNNFTGQKIYPPPNTTYLRRKAASLLAVVQKKLKLKGMGLKIFDAYRPYAATKLIWELVKDERYAANPEKGSHHNRGIAVDLTIIDLNTKKELDMGTGFDNFSDSAHHDFKALPDTILKNRLLLRNIMEQNGFKAMETEWWHYALLNPGKYELLDLSFEQLKKI